MPITTRSFFLCSLAIFLVTISGVIGYSSYLLLRNDGSMLSTIAANVIKKVRTPAQGKKSLPEKVVARLFANNGKLLSSILRDSFRRPLRQSDGTTPMSRTIQKALFRLLENDARLLTSVLKGMQRRSRTPPVQVFLNKLLANNGELLVKVVKSVLKKTSSAKGSSKSFLVENRGVLTRILNDVLDQLGAKTLVSDVRLKLRRVNTTVSLRQEIRLALRLLPGMIVKLMELRRQAKMVKHKDWRAIKARYPKIKQAILTHACIRKVKLRRGRHNQLIVRPKIRWNGRDKSNQKCKKLQCEQYVGHIDKSILRYTRSLGVHEGHINIRFGLALLRCNSRR